MTMTSYRLPIGDRDETTIIVDCPTNHDTHLPVLILGHGAGAGIQHQFFETLVPLIADLGINVVRYNFLYMEKGRKLPDQKPTCFKVISAVISFSREKFPGSRIFLGGKSFGGRMSSLYLASHSDSSINGLLFLGFPLHNPEKVDSSRADHLKEIDVRSLFLQGTRDKLADLTLLKQVVSELPKASISIIDGADHSFEVLKKSGLKQDDVYERLAREVAVFIAAD
jgi:predicted alpha/beta-hydrolase family hydrolase